MIEEILSLFTAADEKRILVMLSLILFDVVLGVALSLLHGEFDFKKLPQFLKTMILPYLIGFVFFEAWLRIMPPSDTLVEWGVDPSKNLTVLDNGILWTAYGALILHLAKSVWDNLGKLLTYAGVNIQTAIEKAKTPPPQ